MYRTKYDELVKKYDLIQNRLILIDELKFESKSRLEKINIFLNQLKQNDKIITEFDEQLWYSMIEKVIVHSSGKFEFIFKDGRSIFN